MPDAMTTTMTLPVISAALAGVILILQQILMLATGTRRGKTGQGVGVAGDVELERMARRHGNLAENSGIFIASLALLELLIGSGMTVQIFALVFLVARLFHALGFSTLRGSHGKIDGETAPGSALFVGLRAGGATLTALSGIALGGFILFNVWGYLPF
ncbi:MAG: MAPEG family protein [Alphaproteobacteria bacterium]|uniref:MAPEG family protein n=1 Tax=Pyruvatibacter sp. HU-CL02332 TaxID=3127650 RepID=UPI00296974A9|nr:MAPEG family protein [Alphaproteobacteria bacterium]